MNKNFLSAVLFGALMVSSTGTFVSCKDYDDDIDDLRTQINANATAIEKINSLITGGSVISKVDKSNNGVTVTLSNGDSFELKNGEDGEPATVWTIGEDGYWYKDDVKTDYKAVGTNGNQGAPGINGAFYRPNVETGFFDYVTIDTEGKETVKATDITWKSNDGSITAAVTEGDVILSGVKGLPDGKVVIPRNNLLRSLVFVPEIYVEGIPGMPYYNVAYAQKKINDKKDSEKELFTNVDTKKEYNVELNKGIIAQYHVNPTNANATDLQKLALATRNVPYITARSENFEATATYKSFADGILTVGIELGDGISSWLDQSKNDSIPVAALQVIREGKDTITSDYATLYKAEVKGVKIANPCAKADEHYRYAISNSNLKTADAAVVLGDKVVWNEAPTDYADCDTTLVDGKTLDLKSIVAAHGMLQKEDNKTECLKLNTDVYGWTWNFEVVKNYILGKNETPQDAFVALDGSVLSTKVYDDPSAGAAIGRTPIIRVTLTDADGKVVAAGYIKIRIIKDTTPSRDEITIDLGEVVFACTGGEKVVDTKAMNTLIYNKVGMAKDAFHNHFKEFKAYNGIKDNLGTVAQIEDKEAISGKSYNLNWEFNTIEIWSNSGKEMTHRVVYYDNATPSAATDSLVVILKATAENIGKSADIKKADYIKEYWDAAKTFTSFNFRTPNVGESTTTKFELVTDINGSFTTLGGKILVTEGITGNEDTYTGFYFCMEDMKKITKIGDLNVKFFFAPTDEADNDSTTLYAELYDKDNKIIGKREMVAHIYNGITTKSFEGKVMPNYIQYGEFIPKADAATPVSATTKAGDVAKRLLNTDAMYALIGANQYACGAKAQKVALSFEGADHFKARIIRPVYANKKSNGNFIDGKDKLDWDAENVDYTKAEVGTYMAIENLVDLYDWRNRQFSNATYSSYYYDYYGIKSIIANVEKTTCDLNGVAGTAIPSDMVLDWRPVEKETTVGKDKTAQKSSRGFVTYYNGGKTVTSAFNLSIPVTIEYAWGTIETSVTVPVQPTEGQN